MAPIALATNSTRAVNWCIDVIPMPLSLCVAACRLCKRQIRMHGLSQIATVPIPTGCHDNAHAHSEHTHTLTRNVPRPRWASLSSAPRGPALSAGNFRVALLENFKENKFIPRRRRSGEALDVSAMSPRRGVSGSCQFGATALMESWALAAGHTGES
jgi:hypothetical protein